MLCGSFYVHSKKTPNKDEQERNRKESAILPSICFNCCARSMFSLLLMWSPQLACYCYFRYFFPPFYNFCCCYFLPYLALIGNCQILVLFSVLWFHQWHEAILINRKSLPISKFRFNFRHVDNSFDEPSKNLSLLTDSIKCHPWSAPSWLNVTHTPRGKTRVVISAHTSTQSRSNSSN